LFFGGTDLKNEIIVPSVNNSSIKIFDAKKKATTESFYDWHFHDEFELFMLYEGTKIFQTSDRELQLHPGDIIFVNRRTLHKTVTPVGSRGILIQFNEDFSFQNATFDKYALALLKNTEVAIAVFSAGTPVNMQLCRCITKISNEYSHKDKFYDMYIKSYIFEILAGLYRHDILIAPHKLMDKKSVSAIRPALLYISEHYSEKITLDAISNLMYIEKSHFCKLFKKATKTSFLNYLNFIRICHSEILLRETKMTVAEIATETGFSSASYFAETFKKINLLSPMAYRKKISHDNQ